MGKTVVKVPPDRPSGRMSAEDRRQQILDVAIRLFSQKGFRGTTTKEIALAAGVNEAIIFRHFATKKELYAAILDKKACVIEEGGGYDEAEDAMRRGDDRVALESIAFHILENNVRDDAFMRLLLYSALEGHELAEMFYRTQITQYYRELAAYFARRMDEGKLRRVDPMTAVRAFIGMVVYHAQMNKFYARDLLDISNQEAAKRFTDLFLAGMTTGIEPSEQRPRRGRRRQPELN